MTRAYNVVDMERSGAGLLIRMSQGRALPGDADAKGL